MTARTDRDVRAPDDIRRRIFQPHLVSFDRICEQCIFWKNDSFHQFPERAVEAGFAYRNRFTADFFGAALGVQIDFDRAGVQQTVDPEAAPGAETFGIAVSFYLKGAVDFDLFS